MEKKVSQKKIESVKRLVELIKNKDTIIIASIKGLPSKQFQEIRKKLRKDAEVVVIKKKIMLKAIENAKKAEELNKYVKENSAVLFSELDTFELAGILAENKNPIGAKAGQIAEEDILVQEGPTDIMPGPAISEFGSLGIPIAVEDGKIAIKQKKVIVKSGEKIKEAAASIMSKLDIKPFTIGIEPLAIYDGKTGKVFVDVKINKEKTREDLRTAAAKALGFAQKVVFYCKETIGHLLAKANAQEQAISKLQANSEEKQEKEEKSENTEEKQEGSGKNETDVQPETTGEKNKSEEDK